MIHRTTKGSCSMVLIRRLPLRACIEGVRVRSPIPPTKLRFRAAEAEVVAPPPAVVPPVELLREDCEA